MQCPTPSTRRPLTRVSTIVLCVAVSLIAAACASAPAAPTPETRAALDSAWSALERNDFSASRDAFAAVAGGKATDRERAEALRGEGLALFALGETAEAVRALSESITASPSDVESAVVRAFISRTMSLSDADVAALRKVDLLLSLKGMPAWSLRAGERGLMDSAMESSLDPASAARAAVALGAVTDWRATKPYPNPSGGGFDTAFVDETGLYAMPASALGIKTVGPTGLVVPSEYLGKPGFSVHYAFGEITTTEAGSYWVVVDRDSVAVKLWLDGTPILSDAEYASGEDGLWARVELAEGVHVIAVKIAALNAQGSFRVFVDKASTSAASDAAASLAFAGLAGAGRASAGPAIGILAAQYGASPDFGRAIWLSAALSFAGYGYEGAAVIERRAWSAGPGSSYLAAWAEYRALMSAGKGPEARAAMAGIPFGAGFAPRDDQEISAALAREDWAEASRLAALSIGASSPRYGADMMAALAALGSGADGFASYQRFMKAYPGYGDIGRRAYAMGGLGQNQGVLLDDWAHGDYLYEARMALFDEMFSGGAFASAFKLGWALQAFEPWNTALAVKEVQAGYYSGTINYDVFISLIEDIMRERPGSAAALWAALEPCMNVVTSLDRMASSGALMQPAAMKARADETERLKRLLRRALDVDPSDFGLRERYDALEGKESIDARYSTFRPEEAIARFEASGTKPGGDVAVVYDSDTRIFFPDAGTRYYRSYVLKILSRAGLEAEGTQVFYAPAGGYSALKRAFVRKPDGRVVPAMASDGRVNFTGLAVGDYIVMEYVSNGSRKDFFADDFWLDEPLVGYGFVFERDLRLVYPASQKPAYAIHGDASAVKVSEPGSMDGFRETLFEVRSARPAARFLPSPDARDALTWVDVSTIPDWGRVATWYADLASGAALPTRDVDRLAASLTRGARDSDDAVRLLFEYASQTVRYEDLAFQYSAHVPEGAAAVASAGSGDCKDKAALLSALLASVGIESRYALSEPSYRGPNAYLPSPRFSHVIVLVKRGAEWLPLDPTGSTFTYPDMPSVLVGTRVLEIPPAGGEPPAGLTVLEPTSRYGSAWIVELALKRSSAKARTTAVLRGDEAASLRSALESDDEGFRRSVIDAFAASYLPGSTVGSYSCDDERTLRKSPLLRVDSDGPSALVRQGSQYSVSLSWMRELGDELLFASRAGERSSPATVGGGQLEAPYRQTFVITLPDGFTVASMPRAETLSFGAAKAAFRYAQEGGKLIVEREYYFPATAVAPSDMAALRDFAARLWAKESETVLLSARAE